MRAIIGMGHSLGLKMVVKGVGSAQQLVQLRELHCDVTQGNYHSPPLEAEAFHALLAQQRHAITTLNMPSASPLRA